MYLPRRSFQDTTPFIYSDTVRTSGALPSYRYILSLLLLLIKMRGDKYLLSSVQTLTFYKDKLTQARRTDPIRELQAIVKVDRVFLNLDTNCITAAQLTCSGKACNLFQPEAIQCTNMGDDGSGNVQWKVSRCYEEGTIDPTHTPFTI
jgi:hypothetical protein